MKPIVIAAGGTGGHFFPAEALAATLVARGHRVVLMTDARSGALQSAVFAGRETYVLRGAGLAGRGVARQAKALASLAIGVAQARRILKSLDAAAIIGFGGYPSVAPILAARMWRGRPALLLHEQNAVLGRANRWLARRVDLLALGFSETAHVPQGVTTLVTGNPVRPAILALGGVPHVPPLDSVELLVLGGSLGARIFGDVVPAAIAALPDALRSRLRITQQCRVEDLGRVRAAYRACGIEAELAPFFADVASCLAAAHLVITRAGASTCAELAVAGRPAILVPLPSAIDDHQSANAAALSGATVIAQRDFSPDTLAALLAARLSDAVGLAEAAVAIAAPVRADAAAILADRIEALLSADVAS